MEIKNMFNKSEHIIWDAHAYPTLEVGSDLSSLFKFKKYGYSYVCLNVGFEPQSKNEVTNIINYITNYIDENSKNLQLVKSTDEILEAKKTNKLAISFDIEGIGPFENLIENIEFFYNLGVKQIAPVYNKNNNFGGGCFDHDTGLKSSGLDFIDEMNRLGILIDCSHAGYKTCFDIINASSKAIIFSHSNPKELKNHERNIPDQLIINCAKKGGVIGLNGINIFLKNQIITAGNFVNHIDYIRNLVGIEHVGFGLDFVFELKKTLELVKLHPDKFPNSKQYSKIKMIAPNFIDDIIDELIKRSYSSDEVKLIIGGNFFKVAKSIWTSSV